MYRSFVILLFRVDHFTDCIHFALHIIAHTMILGRGKNRSFINLMFLQVICILNLSPYQKAMSTLKYRYTSTSYSTIGLSSKFRLPKVKMAKNKHLYTIQDEETCGLFRFSVISSYGCSLSS